MHFKKISRKLKKRKQTEKMRKNEKTRAIRIYFKFAIDLFLLL